MPDQAWTRRRMAAREYQPKTIRLLLIAESPPAGDRHFYFADAAEADELFEEVCAVLFEAQPGRDRGPFLKELRRRGVFMVELKPDAPRQDEPLSSYVAPMLLNVETLAPEKIVLIDSDVYGACFKPMSKAGLPVVDVRVLHPAAGEAVEFRQKFRQALVRAGLEKLIRPLPSSARRPPPSD